ncbi:hypothetical protein BDZ45DRAFT_740063 [Acephala macrosclerotiorum]|nr:hypothetical protein BDZ45DRAFT_740063 [Acephala macrosclerotiorum]
MPPTTPPENIPSPPEFSFMPSDVRLNIIYKGAPAYAYVSSHAMVLASQSGRTSCSRLGRLVETWRLLSRKEKLDFTDDSEHALLVLLIAHLNSGALPFEQPPRILLVNLAIICNKYMCTKTIKKWIEQWMDVEWRKFDYYNGGYQDYHNPRIPKDCQAMMLCGLVFRWECTMGLDMFNNTCSWMYQNCPIGILPTIPEDWPLPDYIYEEIIAAQDETVQPCLGVLYKYLSKLEDWSTTPCSGRITRSHPLQPCNKSCNKTTYEKVLRRLMRRELYPRSEKGAPIKLLDLVRVPNLELDDIFKLQESTKTEIVVRVHPLNGSKSREALQAESLDFENWGWVTPEEGIEDDVPEENVKDSDDEEGYDARRR